MILQRMLETHGFNVVGSASGPSEAVDLYKKVKPDVVTMDIVMPDGGGVEAIKALYAMDPKAKIVVVSALYGSSEIDQAKELGVSAIVHKPVDWTEIEKAITKVLS
ncbi:MAG: response regulator [Elusimicrobia bacterium]|nr:response regulator [Elusimicrobiota bacterium]